MKLLVLLIIVLSLYLIYRLSFPRQAEKREREETPPKPPDGYESVPKSRFVLPSRSNSAQHEDRMKDSDKQDKKADIFAAGNEKPGTAVIPPEAFGEVFGEDVNPEDLDIEPDESETDGDQEWDADEEAEELRQMLGGATDLAGGLSIGEMTEAVQAIDNPTDEKAELLYRVEPTDMFEKMVSGDEEKAARIRAIIDRNVQRLNPETEEEKSDNDGEWKKFNIADFLS